jgi:hypothetical protein
MLTRRALVHGAAVAAAAALARPLPVHADAGAREAMAQAAATLLGALDGATRQRAVFALGDPERRNWHYVPRSRQGVALKDMTPAARAAAHELVKAALSGVGYAKASNVIQLEDVLRQLETMGSLLRDPERYYVSVFGTPRAESPWGWRIEGHHLSLNFTLVPGRPVAVTPAFFGANPAEVREGPLRGLRTLRDEQDVGLALARSVGASLRPRLVIAAESLGDIVSGPARRESLEAPAGVALGELGADGRAIGMRLLETYVRNMRNEVADEELRKIREAGLDAIRFAWAGPVDPARPHYYRLHGPTVLIEYDNTQNNANHIHSVWHDPRNDFGADLLRAHYEHTFHG